MKDQFFYIPPDVNVDASGNIAGSDWPYVYNFRDFDESWLVSFTGYGMPPLRYIQQTGPEQHGATLLDYRLQPRVIQYIHRKEGACGRQSYWDNRDTIIDILRPNRYAVDAFDTGRLRVIRTDGSIRDIKVIIQQGPAFAARSPNVWDEWSFTEAVRFIAHDPTLFDPARNDIVWAVEVYDGLIFYETPTYADYLTFPDNALFATGILAGTTDVTYTGTWISYPEIEITGPLSNPSIQNVTLGQKIALDYDISAGEIVIIATEYGNKTITNFAGTNLIGTLTSDSDMNFFIAPHPMATTGINQFSAYGDNAVIGQSAITMRYYTRYVGM